MGFNDRVRFLSRLGGRIYSGLFCIGILSGCPRHVTPPAAPAEAHNYQVFDFSASQCEARMRERMRLGDLKFKVSGPLRTVLEAANRNLPVGALPRYLIGENKQIHSVSVEFPLKQDNEMSRLTYRLSVGECSEHPLTLTIEKRGTKATRDQLLSQKFWLADTCDPRLSETITKDLAREPNGKWRYREITHRPDASRSVKEDQFTTDLPLLNVNLDHNLDDPFRTLEMPREAAVFLPDLGLTHAVFNESAPMRIHKFGFDLELAGGHFILDRFGRPVASNYVGRDVAHNVILTESRHRRTYRVPRELFETVNLGSLIGANEFVTVRLGEGYLEQANRVRLTTAHEPTYDHLSAYWSIHDRFRDPATGLLKLDLVSNALGTVKSKREPEDLASNDTIQTEHRMVQLAAQDIHAQAPGNRRAQLGLILQYLSDHFTFDFRDSQHAENRALTTTEVLDRGRGACRHYAVLFASLARALGIPTRIVNGYHLHNLSADDYTWVEAEILPGEFRVIDPTGRTLGDTEPRYYFPIERARELEDKDAPAKLETTLSPQDYSLVFERGSL